MNYSMLFSVVFIIGFVGKVYTDSLCAGLDVTNDPRIEARMLDGHWYTQRGLTSTRISNSIVYYQFQGKIEWHNDWNQTTRTCTYRKYEETQQQSLENGPYSPCFKFRQLLLPVDAEAVDGSILYYMPTKNLLMFYICPPDQVRNDQSCAIRPFVRVLTRTLDISQKELSIIRMRLRRFGVTQTLDVNNPRENECCLPTQRGRPGQSRGHGRKNKQW